MNPLPESEGCFTSEGFTPHKRIKLANGHTLRAPVAVRVVPMSPGQALHQVPVRTFRGDLVYVLPGGDVTT